MAFVLAKTASLRGRSINWLDKAAARSAYSAAKEAANEAGVDFAREDLNTLDAFLQRRKLKHHPRVRGALDNWWNAAIRNVRLTRPSAEELGFVEFRELNRSAFRYLLDDEDFDEDEVEEATADEWATRSSGGTMGQASFVNGMYELVDVSVPSLEVLAYQEFVEEYSEATSQALSDPVLGADGKPLYAPSTDPAKLRPHVRVYQIEVEGLPDKDVGHKGGSSDPYVVFNLEMNSHVVSSARTPAADNSRSFKWKGLDLSLAMTEGQAKLRVAVWDDDSDEGKEDEVMGALMIDVRSQHQAPPRTLMP